MNRIIYPNNEGGLSVVVPTGELPIEDVAAKDVPKGVAYLIISAEDVPSDRTFRGAWEADFSNPDGYGIGADDYHAAKEAEAAAEQIIDTIAEDPEQ